MHIRKAVTTVNKRLYNNKLDIIYRGCEYMHSNRALRASLLSFLLVLGSFTVFIVPSVCAEPDDERTDLYFTKYNTIISQILFPSEDDYYYGDSLIGNITSQMSTTRPIEEEDSSWPPKKIFTDNQSADFQDRINQDYIELGIMWMVYNNPELVTELAKNFTQGDPLFESIIDKIDYELINPFRINEDFTYNGKESIILNGKIIFDLYLSSKSKMLRRDSIKVSISTTSTILGVPISSEEIKNVTTTIEPTLKNSVKKQQIELDLSNESIIIEPGDTLRFSVELIPKNKPVLKAWFSRDGILDWRNMENILNQLQNRAEKMSGRNGQILKGIGDLLLSLFNVTELLPNNTSLSDLIIYEDIFDFINVQTGSSFIFASTAHPSRVILPIELTNSEENTKTFYLHDENVMDTSQPAGIEKNLNLETTPLIWDRQTLGERNKIIKDASVNLYFRNLRLKKPVTVTLVDNNNTEIASITQDVEGFSIGNDPTTFTFNDLDYELFYNHQLNLYASLSNGTGSGILRHTKLLYDSYDHPSSVTVELGETDNIQFEITSDPEDALIIPGGELKYTLSIESLYDDEIDLDISEDKSGDWSYSIVEPLPISIPAGETEEINVIVKSENNKNEAYGDEIDLTFEVSGKTGIDKKTATALVDQEAIEYNIDIYGQDESKNIKKGNSGTFYFVIENKNTGAIDDEDSYTITASSKNDWELKFTDSTPSLEIGEKTDTKRIFVKVYVPENTTINSDIITVTVTSDNNPEASEIINVTVNALQPSIFENIVEFFKSTANSLGIDDMFGSKAPYVLAGILAILIILIILILIFILRRKSVKIICTERIQEIDPSEEAIFDITLNNPTRKTKTYEITSKISPESSKWQTATDVEKITIAARSSKQILLVAKPEETVESNDWTEIKLNVSVSGKKKSEEITTMVMAKDGKTILRIKNVFSWPREFKEGDRIVTSFILENKGNISARNVKVILFTNGKQKNKVEVTIPRGGYAEIKIPWIALKGKNDLELKAIEQ
jgi:hypothetical protein